MEVLLAMSSFLAAPTQPCAEEPGAAGSAQAYTGAGVESPRDPIEEDDPR